MAERSDPGRFAIAAGALVLLAAGLLWMVPSAKLGEPDPAPAPAGPNVGDDAMLLPSSALSPSSAVVPDSGADPRSLSTPDPRASASTPALEAGRGDAQHGADSVEAEAGAHGPTAEWIEERYEEAQKNRAAIKDAATRNHRKQNREELARSWAIEFALIDEIGVSAYEQLLYDRGLKNRSEVRWLGSGSNAMRGGVEIGDEILSYGGQPVFSPQSIRERNKLLEPGQQIVIEVDRGGVVLAFEVNADERNRGRSGIVNGISLRPISRAP